MGAPGAPLPSTFGALLLLDLLALLLVLLRLSYGLDLWGALEPTFAPVLAWVCLALLASDEASGRGDYNGESDWVYL